MRDELRRVLERQGYGVMGEHSAVKVCHWTKSALTGGKGCYKADFYGIESERCVQMTPLVDYCNKTCLYCWRSQDFDVAPQRDHFDDPNLLVEAMVEQQLRLLSGFKGDPRVTRERWNEATMPRHVAISLNGEPTFYPRLAELIRLCHDRGITTFLVTNGTTPKVLRKLDPLPTQLYVSLDAADRATFDRLGVPLAENAWDLLMETLRLLPSLRTRKVIRHTLVKGWNMEDVEGFARLDAVAQPDFIECKAFMFVGGARARMTIDNMPRHHEVAAFARRLAEVLGYEYTLEREDSRVVLLVRPGAERRLSDAAPFRASVHQAPGRGGLPIVQAVAAGHACAGCA